MRTSHLLATAVVLVACSKQAADPAVGSGSGSAPPAMAAIAAPPTAAADPATALIARGEYVAALMQCETCHTPLADDGRGPDRAKAFAGGLEVTEPFGTWRTSNITMDKSSGIGSWTDDQILTAVREGLRPDGKQLSAIMPYLNYNRMTDADGKALVAYLKSRPTVDHVVAPMAPLAIPSPPAPRPANAPDPTGDKVKHGEYVATLMHCTACHTSPDHRTPWIGGFSLEAAYMGTGTLFAANLTSDVETGIGKYSEDDLVASLKTMTRPDHSLIRGPMLLYQPLWGKVTDDDLHAVAAFIKQLPPVKNKVPPATFVMRR